MSTVGDTVAKQSLSCRLSLPGPCVSITAGNRRERDIGRSTEPRQIHCNVQTHRDTCVCLQITHTDTIQRHTHTEDTDRRIQRHTHNTAIHVQRHL